MILISHRGNIGGAIPDIENKPDYIDAAIKLNFDVEIDVWMVDNEFFLGHDRPQYEIDVEWINTRSDKLWVHCKNIDVLEFFNQLKSNINYFWHQEDTATLTSKRFVWAFPGKQPIKNSIAVMPEIHKEDINQCIGVCSNYINRYT